MRKKLTEQQGLTLLEVMISITLTMMLLPGMLQLFSTSLTIWNLEKNRTNLQQTARIAVDRIMRDIRYAQNISLNHPQSLNVTKLNGETDTFQLGGEQHANTLYMIINGLSANPLTENVVTNLSFTPYPQPDNIQAITITLEVTDHRTGEKQTIQTAGYPLNKN